MRIHLFAYGLLIRLVGSQVVNICDGETFGAKHPVERINKCMDHLFEVCTKAANDIDDIFDIVKKKTMKAEKCDAAVAALGFKRITLAYLMIMEKYDHEADYYEDLIWFPHSYIRHFVKGFKANDDHNQFMPMICPNYTMNACRSLLTFCEHNDYATSCAYCTDPSFVPYKEYLECYFTPSKAKADCRMVCDKVVTKKLFGIEKTDDVYCKKGKERWCKNIERAALISECEGHFKEKCDVSDGNTYSQCEEAIRSMKISPQLISSTLETHKCSDSNSRLICFQYFKLLGEGKMASQFVKSQCTKQPKPDICNILEDYCGNSNLTLPVDPPECKPQTEEVTTSLSALHNQSDHISTTVISTTQNRKTEQQISFFFLIGLLLLI